jgi:hypothetical protein
MQREPILTETYSRPADIGPDTPVRPLPTVRPATHSVSDIPIQIVTDDHVRDRAVLRWRKPKYLTYSTFAARAWSFFNWTQHLPKPTPVSLCKAGFYYTGKCIFLLYAQYTYFVSVPLFICTRLQVSVTRLSASNVGVRWLTGDSKITLSLITRHGSPTVCTSITLRTLISSGTVCECVHYVRGTWNTNTHAKDCDQQRLSHVLFIYYFPHLTLCPIFHL